MIFSRVRHSADKVAIFGTGRSIAKQGWVMPDPSVSTIAVNMAIRFIPAHYWFTLDPNIYMRGLMMFQREGTVYYAAVPDDYGQPFAVCADHQREPEDNVIFLRRLTGDDKVLNFSRKGLSRDKGAIHTGNSGFGALQLAVLMGAKKIALFGIDGFGKYVWGGTPTKYLELMPELFASTTEDLKELGVQVVNGSPFSSVDCFDRVEAAEAMEWINAD